MELGNVDSLNLGVGQQGTPGYGCQYLRSPVLGKEYEYGSKERLMAGLGSSQGWQWRRYNRGPFKSKVGENNYLRYDYQ